MFRLPIRVHFWLMVLTTIVGLFGFTIAFVRLTLPWKDAWWYLPGSMASFVLGGLVPPLVFRKLVRARCPRSGCGSGVRCLSTSPLQYRCQRCRFHLKSTFTMGFGAEGGSGD
jgi:hypothetical protein